MKKAVDKGAKRYLVSREVIEKSLLQRAFREILCDNTMFLIAIITKNV